MQRADVIQSTPKHRQSIRLPEYDYASPGAYFVTICTYGKVCLFGDPQIRRIVETVWCWTTRAILEGGGVDYVVMPNHVHGIVWIQEANAVGAQHPDYPSHPAQTLLSKPHRNAGIDAGAAPLQADAVRPRVVGKRSLAAMVRTFKSVATQRINAVRCTPGAAVWQRNYYEHIVRSEAELHRIREYIANNPAKWQLDRENPNRVRDIAYEKEWEWLEGANA